jgi:hypothetical protein
MIKLTFVPQKAYIGSKNTCFFEDDSFPLCPKLIIINTYLKKSILNTFIIISRGRKIGFLFLHKKIIVVFYKYNIVSSQHF